MASHSNVKVIQSDAEFQIEFQKCSNGLLVVDFTASWCGPCHRIAPLFAEFSLKFNDAVFLKVDVDICKATAANFGVRAMPTFLFFLHGIKVDEVRGADAANLEAKIATWSANTSLVPVNAAKANQGRQLDCFRELLENPPDIFQTTADLLLRIANNILKDPHEPKYRALKLGTNTFKNKLLPVKGAVECLFAMGFEESNEEVVLQAEKSLDHLKILREAILDEQNKREVLLKTMQRS